MIEVSDYDPAWAARFVALREEYAAALSDAGVPVVAIEHVGSTAVPGLAAKPIIDCDIVVRAEHVEAASAVLVSLGFEARGELGIPQRWAFWEPARLVGTNTYVIVEGSLALHNHLAVRDVLRSDPSLRDEYGEVKKRVGATAADIYEYGGGKNDMVQRILAAAGMSEAERDSINSNEVPVTPRKR
ncbi:GrpB family protein [Nocardioides sp. NPDC101246]|uniref:GrpB family protein n=1 Tax=Nocardioides sp. NPDC101246 TaxID=3364336 RepID=UPI00382F66E4